MLLRRALTADEKHKSFTDVGFPHFLDAVGREFSDEGLHLNNGQRVRKGQAGAFSGAYMLPQVLCGLNASLLVSALQPIENRVERVGRW